MSSSDRHPQTFFDFGVKADCKTTRVETSRNLEGHSTTRLASVFSDFFGVCMQVLAAGRAKMATMPAGGAAVASSGAPAVGGGDASAPTEQPKAKEPEPEEEEEDMGFDLFD